MANPNDPPPAPPSAEWLYRVESAAAHALSLAKTLAGAGKDGWELVSVQPSQSPNDPPGWVLVFKKPGE